MEKQTNLYLITTSGMGEFYVTGEDPGEAQNKLLNRLKDNGDSFRYDQKVVNIKFLGEKWLSNQRLERFID